MGFGEALGEGFGDKGEILLGAEKISFTFSLIIFTCDLLFYLKHRQFICIYVHFMRLYIQRSRSVLNGPIEFVCALAYSFLGHMIILLDFIY